VGTVFLGFMWKGGKWRSGYKEIRVLRDWGKYGKWGIGENGKRGVKRNWNFLTYNEPNERALYLSKK